MVGPVYAQTHFQENETIKLRCCPLVLKINNVLTRANFASRHQIDAEWSFRTSTLRRHVVLVAGDAWVAAFIALGLFPSRIDAIIATWLAITFTNEITIDAPIFEKRFTGRRHRLLRGRARPEARQ